MTPWLWGRIVWYGVFVALVFGGLELSARDLFGDAPWPTFSATVQHDAHAHPWFAALVATIVLGVGVHWLFDQPFFPSLIFALSVAVSAHLLNNRWP